MIFRLILQAVAVYALIVIGVYLGQRHLQYFPDNRKPGDPAEWGLREVFVETEDGLKLLAWFAPPKEKDGRIVVLFHGNAGNIGDRGVKARHFIERGYGVYMCEYRGYGGNRGAPSEEGLYKDARAGLKWLEAQGHVPAQFALYGESIGSGVAVRMAQETAAPVLILEAPFSSAVDVARKTYPWLPVDLLMKDRFENDAKIKDISASLLIVHGDEDAVIPIALSKKLFEAAKHPKEFVTINGGAHNDLYDHHAGHIIADWLDGQKP